MIKRLFNRIERPGSQLVLFDVNRLGAIDDLVKPRYRNELKPLLELRDQAYTLTILTNASSGTERLEQHQRVGTTVDSSVLDLTWPREVFSHSHGCLPITPDDPIYGTREATGRAGLPLGSLGLRGETGVLQISEPLMLRLRYNPFYEWTEQQLMDWLSSTLAAREEETEL